MCVCVSINDFTFIKTKFDITLAKKFKLKLKKI